MGWFLVGTLGVVALLLGLVWLAWLTGGLSDVLDVIASRLGLVARNDPPAAERGQESN